MENKVWVAFGDSLTYGYAIDEKDTWVKLVSKHFGKDIINLGVPGETSSDGRLRFDQVLNLKPRLVLINFGTNDQTHVSLHQPKVDVDTYRDNMTYFITRLLESGAKVILTTPHRIIEESFAEGQRQMNDTEPPNGFYFYGRHPRAYYQGTSPNEVLASYVEVLLELAEEFGIPILDLYHSKRMDHVEEVMISIKNSNLYDGVHYSVKGSSVVSEEIIRLIEKYI